MFRLIALALISFLSSVTPTRADWTISVLTVGPGPLVYERFGHNAIRLRDDARGIDVCYDWGNFDFEEPNFVGRFVRGDLLYWMQQKPTRPLIEAYAGRQDRTVTEQTLDLTPNQVDRLVEHILAQDTDATRFYRYDSFTDNCSTRLRDAVDDASAGALRRATADVTPHGYRWHERRLMSVRATNTLLAILIDATFGPRTDRPLTRWEACFLPTTLADELDRTRLPDGRPLVRERRVLNQTTSPMNAEPANASDPVWITLPAGVAAAAALLTFARFWWPGFVLGATLWESFALFGALFLTTMVSFTQHRVMAWNENFLQFTPLAVFVLAAAWRRSWRRRLAWAAALAVGLSAAGTLVTISHLTPQRNGATVAFALPLHAAIWAGLRMRRTRDARPTPTRTDA